MPPREVILNICFPFSVDTNPGGELDEWEDAFNRVSERLYHATNKQMKLGVINVFVNSARDSETDVLIEEVEEGQSTTGTFINLFREERNFPWVILHELGHYEFALGDEYRKYMWLDGRRWMTHGPCTDYPIDQSCIMQFSDDSRVNEFCHSMTTTQGKHQADNEQHQIYGKSCWDTITTKYSSFVVPTPKRQFGVDPDLGSHSDIVWSMKSGGTGNVIVMESTAQFANADFVKGQTNGLGFWIDFVWMERQSIALVNSAGESVFDMEQLDDEEAVRQAHEAVSNVAFAGETNVSDILRQFSLQFDKTQEFQTKNANWISGDTFAAAPGQGSATPLRQKGIRVNSIGLGSRDPFFTLSQETRGAIRKVHKSEYLEDFIFRVQNSLIECCLDSQKSYQQLASRLVRFPNIRIAADPPKKSSKRDEAILDKVLIEPGTKQILFAISLSSPAAVNVEVLRPDDKALDLGSAAEVSNVDKPYYKLIKIKNPIAGIWSVRVCAPTSKKSRFVKMYAYSVHPNWVVKLRSWRAGPRAVSFFGSAFADGELENMEPVVVKVYAPEWRDTAPDPMLEQKLILEPSRFLTPGKEATYEVDGQIYRGSVNVNKAGLYTIEARFVNAGRASLQGSVEKQLTPIHPFVRTIVRQIQITE